MAYRAGLPLVLRGVSLQLAPGEKLEVVTGAGHHSEDHQAKIKPAVIEYLGKKKLRWEELNAGDLLVYT